MSEHPEHINIITSTGIFTAMSWVGSGVQAAKVSWEVACRAEDLNFRQELIKRATIDDNRHKSKLDRCTSIIIIAFMHTSNNRTSRFNHVSVSFYLIGGEIAGQLKAITALSGIFAGFSFTVLTNLKIPSKF